MSTNKPESRKVRCGNCGLTTTEDKIVQPEDTPDLYVNVRLDPGGEVPAGECPDCGALCYLVKPTATPALLDVARGVLDIIELTYRHDDDGNRLIDEPGKYSGADVVEWLLELEDDLAAAIDEATETISEQHKRSTAGELRKRWKPVAPEIAEALAIAAECRGPSDSELAMDAAKHWLLIIHGDIEPELVGPFASEEARDRIALEHRQEDADGNDGLYAVDAVSAPEINAYSNSFFIEADGKKES